MVELNKIIQWAKDNNLVCKLNNDYSSTHLIESPWNIGESKFNNISFITNGWIDNTAGVVFATTVKEDFSSLLVVITDNPKYHFVKCVNEFFKPNKCKIIKGKNVQIFPHEIRGSKPEFKFEEMIPGTIYFIPDQQNSMFERDPQNNVIIKYNIFTGEKIEEIPIGG